MSTDSAASHDSHVAHHFKNAEHQYDSAKQGIWLFMVTEILMFGGLFVGYFLFHHKYPEMFAEGAKQLSWVMGTINTCVLLFSSWTMALAVMYTQKGERDKAFNMLMVTIGCGLIFMVVKYIEYTSKIHHGFLPGIWLNTEHVNPVHSNLGLYFGFYFCMTGLHGFHVLCGMVLMGWVAKRIKSGELGADYFTPVEGVGIFWHIVDLIWIFLFPLLYLVG